METNIIVNISPPIPYLAKFWFSSYGPKCCQPIKLQDSLKCNISSKKWMMKLNLFLVIFLEHIKKNCFNCFCVLLWCKTFRYITGVQSCSLLHVIWQLEESKYKSTTLISTRNTFRVIISKFMLYFICHHLIVLCMRGRYLQNLYNLPIAVPN